MAEVQAQSSAERLVSAMPAHPGASFHISGGETREPHSTTTSAAPNYRERDTQSNRITIISQQPNPNRESGQRPPPRRSTSRLAHGLVHILVSARGEDGARAPLPPTHPGRDGLAVFVRKRLNKTRGTTASPTTASSGARSPGLARRCWRSGDQRSPHPGEPSRRARGSRGFPSCRSGAGFFSRALATAR